MYKTLSGQGIIILCLAGDFPGRGYRSCSSTALTLVRLWQRNRCYCRWIIICCYGEWEGEHRTDEQRRASSFRCVLVCTAPSLVTSLIGIFSVVLLWRSPRIRALCLLLKPARDLGGYRSMSIYEYLLSAGKRRALCEMGVHSVVCSWPSYSPETVRNLSQCGLSHTCFSVIPAPASCFGPKYGIKSCLDSHSQGTVGCSKCLTATTDSYRNSCYSFGKC